MTTKNVSIISDLGICDIRLAWDIKIKKNGIDLDNLDKLQAKTNMEIYSSSGSLKPGYVSSRREKYQLELYFLKVDDDTSNFHMINDNC